MPRGTTELDSDDDAAFPGGPRAASVTKPASGMSSDAPNNGRRVLALLCFILTFSLQQDPICQVRMTGPAPVPDTLSESRSRTLGVAHSVSPESALRLPLSVRH